MLADIGLIGLAVMGENLVLNLESKGYTVAVFNRTVSKVDCFTAGRGKGKAILGCHSLEELIKNTKSPHIIMLMIKAGLPVEELIKQLIPLLSSGDVIIDGGNSNYNDTERRVKLLESKGLYFIGTGISGGEIGALTGPAIMPGGSHGAWKLISQMFFDISAKAGQKQTPCCNWVGNGGAGHFVKMVHNGIEYGDMQLICEIYWIMKKALHMNNIEIANTFATWNDSNLNSYLVEITSNILKFKDTDGNFLVDKILDSAGQKGTGKWTVEAALDEDIPLTLISSAVFARCLSAEKDQRVQAAEKFLRNSPTQKLKFLNNRTLSPEELHSALYTAKIISYAQGFELISKAGQMHNWNLDLASIALTWRGGCIIRSSFLNDISQAYATDPFLTNLITNTYFKKAIEENQLGLRHTVIFAMDLGISLPALTTAVSWLDGYTSADSPANLLQAQRDYFGAHTYERINQARGKFFHTNWTGKGGKTASSSYSV